MASIFTLDGLSYNVFVPEDGVKRSAQVLDGQNAGRSTGGAMTRDIIGTYYNYVIEIDAQYTAPEEYDRLYEVLTAPVDSHTLVVPYGQETLEFEAYITSVEDTLKTAAGGVNRWGGISASFVAMEPKRYREG